MWWEISNEIKCMKVLQCNSNNNNNFNTQKKHHLNGSTRCSTDDTHSTHISTHSHSVYVVRSWSNTSFYCLVCSRYQLNRQPASQPPTHRTKHRQLHRNNQFNSTVIRYDAMRCVVSSTADTYIALCVWMNVCPLLIQRKIQSKRYIEIHL